MTDAPTPPASVAPTNDPAPPRRRLFFARLAAAVRQQDWFVVALEIAIVVLGVVIGFQVTAWGQDRAEFLPEAVGCHGSGDRLSAS